MQTKIGRVGETNVNKYGSEMEIVEYFNANNIEVKFLKYNYSTITTYDKFLKGKIKNPYDKSVFGVGYIGVGNYKVSEKGEHTHEYNIWRNMLQRCYDEKFQEKYPTYRECSIIEEWFNFQNFATWYNQNYYEIDGERMELDKDILIKGNKLYSPDTCVFVPHFINTIFIKCDSKRGNLPIGVHWDKEKKKYRVTCSDNENKQVRIGRYSTIEDAFNAYKKYKEKLIKQVADEYKEKIPAKLYNTLINYKVEITD